MLLFHCCTALPASHVTSQPMLLCHCHASSPLSCYFASVRLLATVMLLCYSHAALPSVGQLTLSQSRTDVFKSAGVTICFGCTGDTLFPASALLAYLAICPPTSGSVFLLKSGDLLSWQALVSAVCLSWIVYATDFISFLWCGDGVTHHWSILPHHDFPGVWPQALHVTVTLSETMSTHLIILHAARDSVHDSEQLGYANPNLGHLTTGV